VIEVNGYPLQALNISSHNRNGLARQQGKNVFCPQITSPKLLQLTWAGRARRPTRRRASSLRASIRISPVQDGHSWVESFCVESW
jgi:hypothetical protein